MPIILEKIKVPTTIEMVADIFHEHPFTVSLSCIPSFRKIEDNVIVKHLVPLLLKLWKNLVDSENGYAFNSYHGQDIEKYKPRGKKSKNFATTTFSLAENAF